MNHSYSVAMLNISTFVLFRLAVSAALIGIQFISRKNLFL